MADCACNLSTGQSCVYHLLSQPARDITSALARDDAQLERERAS